MAIVFEVSLANVFKIEKRTLPAFLLAALSFSFAISQWSCAAGEKGLQSSEVSESARFLTPEVKVFQVRQLNRRDRKMFEFNPLWSVEGEYLLYQALDQKLPDQPVLRVARVFREGNKMNFKSARDHQAWDGDISNLEEIFSWKAQPLKPEVPVLLNSSPETSPNPFLQEFPDRVLSPDGKKIAFVYSYRGVRNIAMMPYPKNTARSLEHWQTLKANGMVKITEWAFDSFRPTWSPDGKHLAFYTQYNAPGKSGIWSIAVVNTEEKSLTGLQLADRVIVSDVVLDAFQGPEWSSNGQYLLYVKRGKVPTGKNGLRNNVQDPIFVTHIFTGETFLLPTQTAFNRKVRCSKNGILAFEAQAKGRSKIFLATTNLGQEGSVQVSLLR